MAISDKALNIIIGLKDNTGPGAKSIKAGIQSISGQLESLQKTAIGFFSIWQGFEAGKGLFSTAMEFQKVDVQLKNIFGSTQAAQKQFEYLRGESERLGTVLLTSADGYAKIGAAMKIAGFSAAQTQEMFSNLQTAISGLHLSGAQAERVFLAFQQIASKPKVQMEDFSQQLADTVPGAIGVADQAIGGLTGKFSEMTSKGTLLSKDFILPFSRAMAHDFPAATDTAQAAVNRMDNAWKEMQLTLSNQGFMDAVIKGMKELTATLKDPAFQSGLKTFASVLGATIDKIVTHADIIAKIGASFAGMKAGGAVGGLFGPWGRVIGGGIGAVAGAIGAGEITEKPGGGFTPAENAQALGLQYRGLLARLGQLKGSNNPALAEEIARTENHLEMVKQKLLELGQAAQKSGQQLAKPAEGFGYNPASVFAYRGVSGTSATPYDELFHQFEEQYKLPQALLRAIAKQESDFNVAAVSAKGAQGLMQFMPGTARQYGVANPMDAKQAIEGAAKLMADLLKQFGGDVVKALAAYNAGPGKVTVAGGNLAMLPAETQKYVPSVMKNVAEWGNLRVDVDTALRDQKSLLDALSEQRKSAIELDNEAAQDGFKRQEAELKASLDEQALTQDEYYLRLSGLRNLSIDAEIAARRKLIEMTREEAAGQDEAENLRAKTEVAKLLQEITALEARRGEVMDEAITKAIQKENELNQERKERVAGILEQTPQGKAQAQLTEEAQWYEDAQKAGVSAGQWRQGLQVIQQKYGAGANQPDFATQMATSLQANADNLVNGLSSAVANFLFNATDAINRKIQDLQAQMTANAAMGEYQNTVAGRVMLAQNIQSLESQPTMDPTRRAALIQSAQTAQSRAEAVALQNAQQAQQLANQTAFQNSLAGQMLTLFENMGKSLFQDFLSIGLKDLFKQGNTPLNPMYVSIVGMGIPGLGGNGTGLLQLSGFGNASDAGLGSLANTAAQASGQLQNLGANANTAGTGLIGMLQGIGSSIGNFFSQFFSSSGSGGGGALGGILRGLGSLFGGGSAAAAAASSGTAAADLALALFHSGGIVGYSNPVMRAAPPTVMAGAQRWHSGGFPGLFANEVPAILQKGEEVLTANNPRHARNGAGSGSPANIRIINSIDPELARDFLESSRGEQVLHNFISRNAGAIKQTLASQ